MSRIKFYFIVSICVALVACAGMQPTEETLKSVELNGHQISIGMASEKVRELAGEPDSIVQGGNFDSSGAGQVAVDAASFTWWRYFGKSQDVNLKIDEAETVKEIIVTRYTK
jgi:hypothetical protein